MILFILLLIVLGCLAIGFGLKHEDYLMVWMGGLLLLASLAAGTY